MHFYIKLFLLTFLFPTALSAQSGFYLTTAIGVGANADFSVSDKMVSNSSALLADLKMSYQFRIYQKLYAEVGLGGRFINAQGRLDEIDFKAKTLRVMLPVYLGVRATDKFDIAFGTALQNNKDVTEIDLRGRYFWRVNGSLRGRYALSEKWFAHTEISRVLHGDNNSFLLNDTKTAILIGISFLF